MTEGTRIWWEGVSRTETGVIRGLHPLGYIAQLDNGKCVIVAETSVKIK